jgi:hypothetical protein
LVTEALGPVVRVALSPESPVDGAADDIPFVIAADVVTEEVVGQHHVAAPTDHLGVAELGHRRPQPGSTP